MKLLQYPDDCHIKNRESMVRMCKIMNIEYEQTNDRGRLQIKNYDILWLPMFWISPDEVPFAKILYGPHHFVFPDNQICGNANKEWTSRCIYTALSEWNKKLHDDFCSFNSVIPFAPLPFGIKLLPERNLREATIDCLLYAKQRDPNHIQHIQSILDKKKLSYITFTYGSYRDADYQAALMKSKFVIWCGRHESQGFAFQECLSRNIPILVCDAISMFYEIGTYDSYRGKKELKSTCASWWSNECGELIEDRNNFEETLEKIQINLPYYTPRKFIERTLTDEICMKRILSALKISYE
jgi:hypothetical protein